MATATNTNLGSNSSNAKRSGPSLDAWAVLLALGLAFLIWSGVVKHIPW